MFLAVISFVNAGHVSYLVSIGTRNDGSGMFQMMNLVLFSGSCGWLASMAVTDTAELRPYCTGTGGE